MCRCVYDWQSSRHTKHFMTYVADTDWYINYNKLNSWAQLSASERGEEAVME